jgi:hypothetical protein
LGYAKGHRTEWEMPDGVHQFEIVSVSWRLQVKEYGGAFANAKIITVF